MDGVSAGGAGGGVNGVLAKQFADGQIRHRRCDTWPPQPHRTCGPFSY